MADPAKRRATYEDVLAAPEHVVAEIVDGDLSLMPRPRRPVPPSTPIVISTNVYPFRPS
jgi:hypothetical protein